MPKPRSTAKKAKSSAKSKVPTAASSASIGGAFDLDDIKAELDFIDEDSGMRLVSAVKENVTIVGFAPV